MSSFITYTVLCSICSVCCMYKRNQVNVETLLVRQGFTNWNLICQKKCLLGCALEVGAMAYSGEKCPCLKRRKRTSRAEKRREDQISLSLQRYGSCVAQPVSKLKHMLCFEEFLQIRTEQMKFKNKTRPGLWVFLYWLC